MLDFHTQGLFEGDRVWNMKAIGRAAVAGFVTFPQRGAIEGPILLPETPAIAEVILGARAAQAWLRLAVDEEEIVAFTVPAGGHHVDALNRADVVAAALDIRQEVVAPHHTRKLLPIHGVEASRIFGQG